MFKHKPYFAKAFLHTAGQSLYMKINQLYFLMGLAFAISLSGLMIGVKEYHSKKVIAAGVCLLIGSIALYCLSKLEQIIDKYFQGLHGERLVRDQLETLIRKGYEIINDIPCEK